MTALAFATQITQNSYAQRKNNLWQASFGDNLTNEAAQGINSNWDLWNVEWFPLNQTDTQTLISNLELGLLTTLTWQPPYVSATQNFKTVPKTMKVKPVSGTYYLVTVQLRQVP
jgi:phage-related protein